jgi:hypothetical protein
MDFLNAADNHRPVAAYSAEEGHLVSGPRNDIRPTYELARPALAHPRGQRARQEHKVALGCREPPA